LLHVCISAQQIAKDEISLPTSEFKSRIRLIKEKSEKMGLTTSRNNNKQSDSGAGTFFEQRAENIKYKFLFAKK